MRTIVAFDDTGSPGVDTPSNWLKTNRKTYVAVILLSEQIEQLTNSINAGLKLIKARYGIDEFHLTDIMNGKGQWSVMEQTDRFGTFKGLCEVFSEYYIPCVAQTWSKESYDFNNINVSALPDFENLDKYNYEHVAFYLALIKSVKYLYKKNLLDTAYFYCDEGIRKPGVNLSFSFLKNNSISFEESKNNIYLQIADFAAYCFNKSQMLAVKENKTESDWEILKCFQNSGFDFLDSVEINVPKEQLNSELYDYVQWHNHVYVHRN